MSQKILSSFLLLSLMNLVICQDNVPEFQIDFNLDPSIRYNEVFNYFKEDLKTMEHKFYYSVPPKYRDFFQEHEERFKQVNPHAYFAMESLSQIIGIETHQALLVNSIVDFSSFCTSIVVRTQNNTIIHARNLDFDYPDIMTKLIYTAIYVKNNKIIGRAPSIAGYIGSYTGIKEGLFTISYNVRQTRDINGIQENLEKELAGYIPNSQLIQQAFLEAQSYQEAVQILATINTNTPCYFIIGGINQNEGIVIARDREGVNHTTYLNNEQWFAVQGNLDYWKQVDHRYQTAVNALNNIGQENINENTIITDVLGIQGVYQSITIFQAALSAKSNLLNIFVVHKNRYQQINK